MRKTINIDFDNSSSVILGYDPNILGPASTKFAYSTHIHGGVHLDLTNISASATSVSNGLTLALSAASVPAGANNVVYAGDNITLSTTGVSTTVSVYGLADATHNHGGQAFATGMIGGTISSNAWSVSIPDFLLTAAQSDHNHSGVYLPVGASTGYATSVLSTKFLTTAAQSGHTHGVPTGINITIGSSSNALVLSVADKLGTATTLVTTTGSVVSGVGNTSGLTLSFPNFLTTAMQSVCTSVFARTGFTTTATAGTEVVGTNNTDGLKLGVPAFLTTARSSNDAIGLVTAQTNVTWTANSSGLSINAGGYAGTQTSGTNVGLTVNSIGISASINTAGMSALGDGVNILAAGSQTAGTVQTVKFVDSNGIGFGMSGSTQITASYSQSTHSHPYNSIRIADQHLSFVGSGDIILSAESNAYMDFSYETNTVYGSNSSILYLRHSLAGTGVTKTSTSGSELAATLNTKGLSLGIPNWITSGGGGGSGGVAIAGSGTATITSGTVVFQTGNGISFGLNGSTMTASWLSDNYVQTAFSTLLAGASHIHGSIFTSSIGGTNTNITNSSNSSGLTLGIPPYAVTSHTHGDLYPAIAHTHGSIYTVSTGGTVTNILNSSASSGLTLSIPPYAVTSHTHSNLYIAMSGSSAYQTATLASTFATTGHTHSIAIGSVIFVNTSCTNITFSSSTAGSTTSIFAIAGGGSGSGGIALRGSGTYVHSSGTVQFINTNGISFELTGSQMKGSVVHGNMYFSDGAYHTWGSSTNGVSTTIQLTLNTSTGTAGGVAIKGSGTYVHSTGTVGFANSNNITFGLSGNGTMTASAVGFNAMISGNTSGTTANISSGTMTLHGGNNITLWQSGNQLSIVGRGLLALGNTASSNAFTSGSVMLSGVNLSVNTSANGASQYLQISAPAIGYLYFSNTNGHSWGSAVNGVSTSIYIITT